MSVLNDPKSVDGAASEDAANAEVASELPSKTASYGMGTVHPWSSILVVPAAWLGHIASLGIIYSFGILFTAFQEEWPDATTGELGFLGSALTGLFMGSSIIVGKIVKRIGHRRTGLLGGCLVIVGWLAVFAAQKPWQAYPGIALLGFGLNLAWTPGLALLPPHFPARKATVSGIAVTGSGFGTLFWSSINTVLIDEIGLRSTILVLAGLNSFLCFLAASGYSPVPTAKGRQAQDSSLKLGKGSAALQSGGPVRVSAVIREGQARNCVVGQSDSAQSSPKPTPLSRDPVLYVLCLASCTGTIGFFAPFTHTAAFAKELGCGEQTGAGAFMVFGVLSIVGRLLAGPLGDRFGALVVWPSGCASCAGVIFWLGSAPTCAHITASMGVLGLASGPVIALMGPLLVELFGMERFPQALGPMLCCSGVGGMLSPVTAGFIRDLTDSYRTTFVVASCFLLLASLIMLIVKWLHCRQHPGVASEQPASKTANSEQPVLIIEDV